MSLFESALTDPATGLHLPSVVDRVVWAVTVRDGEGRVEYAGLASDARTAEALAAAHVSDYFGAELVFTGEGQARVASFSEDGYARGSVRLEPTPVYRLAWTPSGEK